MNIIQEAIDYFKNTLLSVCRSYQINITYHNTLNGNNVNKDTHVCLGEFIENKNEIRLLRKYDDDLFGEITSLAHEIGHYHANKFPDNFKKDLEKEENFCENYYLILLKTFPAWIVLALQSSVICYGYLSMEYKDTCKYLNYFNIKSLEEAHNSFNIYKTKKGLKTNIIM